MLAGYWWGFRFAGAATGMAVGVWFVFEPWVLWVVVLSWEVLGLFLLSVALVESVLEWVFG